MALFTSSEILRAYENARKSCKNKYEVYLFDQNREECILQMLHEINAGCYVHGTYKELVLHDSKKRFVASPCFIGIPDSVYRYMYAISERYTLADSIFSEMLVLREFIRLIRHIWYLQKDSVYLDVSERCIEILNITKILKARKE